MPDRNVLDLGHSARRLRMVTLVRLRWLAVSGQMAALLVIHFGLGFPLPLMACVLVIAASGVLNIGLRFRYELNHRFDDGPAMVLFAYDILQLSALLFLTGGLQNPFSMLFLAPVMISATSLKQRWTYALVALTGLAASVLVFFHLPLPWFGGQMVEQPFLFTVGVWMAILSGAAFTGFYASRIAEEARKLSDALAATELVLAREQHLSQLDGLAAAAAHELGTPLATISVVAKEMMLWTETPDATLNPEAMREDLSLLNQEVRRCRTILGKLTSLGSDDVNPLTCMTLSHIVAEVAEPLRQFGVAVETTSRGDGAPEPRTLRNPGLLYGLGNLLENAVDFASSRVRVETIWTRDRVAVSIHDDGPGFSSDVLARLGEPYVTTRGPERRAKTEEGSGLGLGLFIAKTLLERSGAALTMRNAAAPERGAIVAVTWPRTTFEKNRDPRKSDTRLYLHY